jgi:hypothetical protein
MSLRANRWDKTSSVLMCFILGLGLSILCLGTLYFTQGIKRWTKIAKPGPTEFEGRGDHALGTQLELEPPGTDEADALMEPGVAQSLQAVSQLVSSTLASMETMDSADLADGRGNGAGDYRQVGPLGFGAATIPASQRWELRFRARDSRHYASLLDACGIELGAIGGGIAHIDYVSHLSTNPLLRNGQSKNEKRLAFMSVYQGVLEKFDRDLLQRSGVPIEGRLSLKFVSKETESILAKVEAAYFEKTRGKAMDLSEVAKTVFECRQGSDDTNRIEWIVIDQRYRIQLAASR